MKPKHIIAAAFIIVASIIVGCKKEEETPAKTNQDCMNESGAGFYADASGNCAFSGALVITSSVNHWNYLQWQLQFIRNGSNTSGTGKMKYNNGAVSVFNWEMDVHNANTIIISGYDNVYTANEWISQITQILPNQSTSPTSFSGETTYNQGTGTFGWTLAAGAL